MYFVDYDVNASNRNISLTPQPTIKIPNYITQTSTYYSFNVTSLSNTCLSHEIYNIPSYNYHHYNKMYSYDDVNCLVAQNQTSFSLDNRVYVELNLKDATNLRLLGVARQKISYYDTITRFFEQGILIRLGGFVDTDYTAITSIKNILCAPIESVSGGINCYPSNFFPQQQNSYPANFKNKYTFSGEEFKLPSCNVDIKYLYDYIDPNYIEGKSPATNKNHD
jgi:hypothetical protein